jgi:hypothetical protein
MKKCHTVTKASTANRLTALAVIRLERRYEAPVEDAAEQIEFLKKTNMPVSHGTRGTFVEIAPPRSLAMIYFIPGVRTYENKTRVGLGEPAYQNARGPRGACKEEVGLI